ncbi:Chaperone protein dnaJ 13 [Platanthera guangdongensis]|uniref:Chaperone protein dnaJ 13 n=1 Tax=Platanthera guangdongensis TaxID=2320717 RepID=A0ABR2LZ86_9ASPA
MDCNKEEATRARDIAEVKMQSRDFVGAKKLLLKALNIFPDIENASHMLTVCEVHCSAGTLVNGQTDHYGILQVDLSADESLIRKQYRKFALLLHPDKNKFTGAEAAFKLVGEAYKLLSDHSSRQNYDVRRRDQIRTASSWKPSQNVGNANKYTAATFNVPKNQFTGLKQQVQQPSTTFFSSQRFWTMCGFCRNRFQYSHSWLNKEVECKNCFRKFSASEVSPQHIPLPSSGFNWSRTGINDTVISAQHSCNYKSQTDASQSSKPIPAANNGYSSRSKDERVGESCGDGSTKHNKEQSVKCSSGYVRRMRSRRVVVNSSDSDSAESDSAESDSAESDSSDTDSISEVDPTVVKGSPTSSRYPRRSNRSKMNVTYEENESEDDDDFVRPLKRLRKFGSKNQDASSPEVVINGVKRQISETSISEDKVNGEQTGDDPYEKNLRREDDQGKGMIAKSKEAVGKKDEKQDTSSANANSSIDSRTRNLQAGSSYSFPDPELYDFDIDRDRSKFSVDQIWAVYDNADGMPRFYALIQKVFLTSFKLQYRWLESVPVSTAERVWVKAGLPIACGNFTLGETRITKNQQMFSHVISCEKIPGNTYNIYPKKGEVWAIFKEWDIGWSSSVEIPNKYVYEFVEVVSDFAYGKDVSVSHLVKIKGFLYLFTKSLNKAITTIPSGQLLKFSHCIPYYKICEEREGIPRYSFELDPAALPDSIVKIVNTVSADDTTEVLNKYGDPTTVKDKLAGSAANNKISRQSENVFETGSGVIRGGIGGNLDVLLNKSDQAKEFQHVTSEMPYNTESRRGETITHSKCDPSNLGAESNEKNDENSSSSEEEHATSQFCNFHDARSEEKFAQGQVWSLYSEIDELPKYYALIKKVQWEESGLIIIKWLEFQPMTEKQKLWSANGLDFGCGRFKVLGGNGHYNSTSPFSHMVCAKPIKKNDLYEIYPNPGEIWAVFKNWSLQWTSKDIRELADFIVVEIIQREKYVIKAMPLTKFKNYNCVFMSETGHLETFDISQDECLKFSHRIPAFKLTHQESSQLTGYWELDPDSVPKILLTQDF